MADSSATDSGRLTSAEEYSRFPAQFFIEWLSLGVGFPPLSALTIPAVKAHPLGGREAVCRLRAPVGGLFQPVGEPGGRAAAGGGGLRLGEEERMAEVCVVEPCIPQVCTQQVHRCQVCAAEVGGDQAGAAQIRAAQHQPGQARSGQVCAWCEEGRMPGIVDIPGADLLTDPAQSFALCR